MGSHRLDELSVLVVCTGNICRSPVAERLLRARLRPAPMRRLHVSSAGVRAVVGHGIDRACADALREFGGDPADHRAVQVTPELIENCGLILTATADHRTTILEESPRAMRRTFTLREFARLGVELDPADYDTLTERVQAVAARRGIDRAFDPQLENISDPLGATPEVVQSCVATISTAVDGVLRVLGLGPTR